MLSDFFFLSNFNDKYIHTFLVVIILIFIRLIINKIIKYKISNISKRYKWYKLNTYIICSLVINFFGWVYILSRRPFSSGDRIEIDGVKGDVIDIKLIKI